MKVNIKCFSTLSDKFDCSYDHEVSLDLDEKTTVGDAIDTLHIPKGDVKIAFLNNRIVDVHQPLKKGDRLTLVPATGGM